MKKNRTSIWRRPSAEALYRLEMGGLRTVISRGIWADYQRSIALGRGSARSERSLDDEER